MSHGKHECSVRDFRWYDSIRTVAGDGMGRQPSRETGPEKVRILQLRATLHQIGTCTLQTGKDPRDILKEIQLLAASELVKLEKW